MAAPISFNAAYRSLKQNGPETVYYLSGDEDVLKDEIIELILTSTVEESCRDFNLDVRSAGDLDGESFNALVETPPMLSEKRVVIVKGIDQWRKNAKVWKVVEQYLGAPSPTTVLVLTSGAGQTPNKTVAKLATHVGLEPLDPNRQRKWIAVRADRAGFGLTEEAVDHLLSTIGPNLSSLATEIEKLATIAAEEEEVDVSAVAELVGVRFGETMHDWVEAVLKRETVRASAMLESVMSASGVSGVRLVSLLGTGLIGVRLARELADNGSPTRRVAASLDATLKRNRIAWTLRDWKNPAALWAAAAEHWTKAEIQSAIKTAYECDKALKSTTVSDERGTLIEMLLRLSRIEVAA